MEKPDLTQIFGTYVSWKLDASTWIINFMNGSQNMYLLEGEDKALLIDTGWGAGNLKAYVKKLTSKPLLVANTHYHPDHAAGNGEFKSVYVSKTYALDEASMAGVPFDITKLPHPDYEKIRVGSGDFIDLGGRRIEVIEARPAHSNSTLFFFDESHGMFFSGDDYESTQVLMYTGDNNPSLSFDIRERLDNLKQNALDILSRKDHIRYLLPNHNGAPIAMEYIDDFIGLVDHIYAGDAVIEDKLNHPFIEQDEMAPQLCRVRWGLASIFVKKADVLEVYGK